MKKLLIILLIAAAVGVLSMAGLVWYVVKEVQKPVEEDVRALVVSADDLVPYFEGFEPNDIYETLYRFELFGLLIELNYEYESEAAPYISTHVSEKGSVLGAKKDMLVQWKAFDISVGTNGITLQENNEFYSVGDQSRFADLILDEEVIGHILMVRKEDFIYMFTMSGFILPDEELWHELFDHRIEALK